MFECRYFEVSGHACQSLHHERAHPSALQLATGNCHPTYLHAANFLLQHGYNQGDISAQQVSRGACSSRIVFMPVFLQKAA
eukprot:1141971-Pelagomonas_calceolata.AAC.2